MAYAKIRIRRDTAEGWRYHNPILAEGEWGCETPNTGVGTGLINVKIGDGVTAWNSSPYAINSAQLIDAFAHMEEAISDISTIRYNSEDDPPTFGDKDFLWISEDATE